MDVARVTGEDGWLHAGFHFTKRLTRLPAGDFEIGLLLLGDEGAEYVMTGQRLRVPAH